MSKSNLKDYHRPFMVVESFVPNESVAACVKNHLSWACGDACIDSDGDGYFIPGKEEEFTTGQTYGGGDPIVIKIKEGKFRILSSGRYVNDVTLAYFYVGEGRLPWGETLSYDSPLFVNLYYATLEVETVPDPFNVYFKEEDYGSGVTNAS